MGYLDNVTVDTDARTVQFGSDVFHVLANPNTATPAPNGSYRVTLNGDDVGGFDVMGGGAFMGTNGARVSIETLTAIATAYVNVMRDAGHEA